MNFWEAYQVSQNDGKVRPRGEQYPWSPVDFRLPAAIDYLDSEFEFIEPEWVDVAWEEVKESRFHKGRVRTRLPPASAWTEVVHIGYGEIKTKECSYNVHCNLDREWQILKEPE